MEKTIKIYLPPLTWIKKSAILLWLVIATMFFAGLLAYTYKSQSVVMMYDGDGVWELLEMLPAELPHAE